MKTLLNVGCGPAGTTPFSKEGWTEVRLDIDPNVKPDIEASITEIPMTAGSVDGVYSSHNLEHLYAHEVPIALKEFFRVLKPGGSLVLAVPDAQAVASAIATGDLDTVLYDSPAGLIAGADILWGHRKYVAAGNAFYQHKTGFSQATLRKQLTEAGFVVASVVSDNTYGLNALAMKPNGTPQFTMTPQGIVATPR
jgi:ubiquinone/menaquinone biosynthesis C-methylase UbiE